MKVIASVAFVLTLIAAACTEREAADLTNALVQATPGPTMAQSSPPLGVQVIQVEIRDGKFQNSVYSAQTGPTTFRIMSDQGPYTLQVDELIPGVPVPAAQETHFETNLAVPGDYTMRLVETGETAILNVRPPGGR